MQNKKIVAIVSNDPFLKKNSDLIEHEEKKLSERLRFVYKSKLDAEQQFSDKCEPIWGNIITYLKTNKQLPDDFSFDSFGIGLDIKEDSICVFRLDEENLLLD